MTLGFLLAFTEADEKDAAEMLLEPARFSDAIFRNFRTVFARCAAATSSP